MKEKEPSWFPQKKNITSDQIFIRSVIKQEYEYKGMKLKRKRKEIKLRLFSV